MANETTDFTVILSGTNVCPVACKFRVRELVIIVTLVTLHDRGGGVSVGSQRAMCVFYLQTCNFLASPFFAPSVDTCELL